MIQRRALIVGVDTLSYSLNQVVTEIIAFINSALLYSHGLRRDTTLYILLGDRGCLKVEGRHIRSYRPDYLSARGLILKALQGGLRRGIIYAEDLTLHDVIYKHQDHLWIELSRSGGVDVESLNIEGHKKILIIDASNEQARPFKDVLRARITPDMYTPDQRVAIVQNWLDRVSEGWRVEC